MLRLLLSINCLLATGLCLAESKQPSPWHWHGFVSQGFVKTSDNSFMGDSENGSWDFTDIGIGGSYKITPKLQVSAQALYRNAGPNSPDGVVLDYGHIDYHAINTMDYGLGIRLGRVKNPYGFYNETRDVAATRPTIFLPQSIYIDNLRTLYHSSDSVNAYGFWQFNAGVLNLDATYGAPLVDEASKHAILTLPTSGDLTNERLAVTRLLWEQSSGALRAALSWGRLNVDYQPGPTDFLVEGDVQSELGLLSLEYNLEKLQLVGEYQRRDIDYRNIYYQGYRNTLPSESWYLQGIWNFNRHWQTVLRYDDYVLDMNDPWGEELAASSIWPASEGYGKDWTIGGRYTFNYNWHIAAEYHYIDGTVWIARPENPNPSEIAEKWHMFAVQVGFRF